MKQWLLILTLLSCLLPAMAVEPSTVVGKINDKVYTYAEYEDILADFFGFYENKLGKPLTPDDKATYNDRCWNELVTRAVYDNAINSGKITITDAELLAEAKRNPPSDIKTIKDFLTNGKFDQKKYEKGLADQPPFRKAVCDEVRVMYKYNKLLKTIKEEVSVSEDSVRQDWLRDQETIDAKIIFFDSNKLTSVNASEEESREYYEQRREEYRKDNCRKYRFVRFQKAPTHEDSLAVSNKAMEMYQELVEGADFADKARQFSKDPGSAKNGGDLGWFGKGKMVQIFEETAFRTAVGQIAKPVLSQFGWHIIQVTDRKMTADGEETQARHILLRVEAGEQTMQKMKGQSTQLYTLAKEKGLVKAARDLDLNVDETSPFQEKDNYMKGIGRDAKLLSFAFSNPVGSLAEIFYAPGGDIFICEISAEIPVYYTPFEDDKARIQGNATKSKRGYSMNQYVQNFVKTLAPEQYMTWAERDSIVVVEIKDHKRGESISAIGVQDEVEKALFSTPEGEYAPLISEPMRWFLVKVEKHRIPDLAIWTKDKKQLLNKALEDLQQDYLTEWYRSEWKKLSIIDNRADYYSLNSKGQQIKLSH